MKKFFKKHVLSATVVALLLCVGAYSFAQTKAQPTLPELGERMNSAASRACLFPVGGWTKVDCSAAAAAQSGQLNAWSRYVVQCRSDSYIAWGDEATDEADSNDGFLPTGSWLEFLTDGTSRYLSCLNVSSDTDCRYIECL